MHTNCPRSHIPRLLPRAHIKFYDIKLIICVLKTIFFDGGVLHHGDTFCGGGCGSLEPTDHLLFWCDIFENLWHRLYKWFGISFIASYSVRDHLHQFGHLTGLSRFTYPFLKVIWHACVWVVSKEKNKIFKRKAMDLDHLSDNVKFMVKS